MSTKYVYGELEVVLTGRVAKKEGKRTSRRTSTPKVDIKYEIKPADEEAGSWTKWVHLEELYEIEVKE